MTIYSSILPAAERPVHPNNANLKCAARITMVNAGTFTVERRRGGVEVTVNLPVSEVRMLAQQSARLLAELEAEDADPPPAA